MDTLKVRIKKVITPEIPAVVEEQEKEIALPFFSKADIIYYMIREDRSVITVVHFQSWDEWNVYWSTDKAREMEKALVGEVISSEEFYDKYNQAMKLIMGDTLQEVESTETI